MTVSRRKEKESSSESMQPLQHELTFGRAAIPVTVTWPVSGYSGSLLVFRIASSRLKHDVYTCVGKGRRQVFHGLLYKLQIKACCPASIKFTEMYQIQTAEREVWAESPKPNLTQR